jgi:hypothetical protein
MRLVLGSARFPAVEPIAAYPFDAIGDSESGGSDFTLDIYGGLDADVAAGAEVVDTEPQHQPGVLRLVAGDGTPVVRIAEPRVLALRSEFGFNGWVRLDSLAAGQTILERPGAYRLAVVADGSEARFEFSGTGASRSGAVRSRVALEAGRWYHFAAHVQGGRLRLATSGDDHVALGDVIGPVADSPGPLWVGVGADALIDDLAVYDFGGAGERGVPEREHRDRRLARRCPGPEDLFGRKRAFPRRVGGAKRAGR